MTKNIWVKNVEVEGFKSALRGMRNPLDSWDKSNSYITPMTGEVVICEDDLNLAQRLIGAGGEHRKFLRQIQVWADVSLPRYIWQELDTYKFGTKNSCSTMHTIMKYPITINDFYLGEDPIIMTVRHMNEEVIPTLNYFRDLYLESKDYRWVREMKRVLPESFVQMRTWSTNYEELLNIYNQRIRTPHRMNEEWRVVGEFIENLPYFKEMILDE